MKENSSIKYIYFGGSLFNNKDLIGNLYLANSIEKISGGRYKCVLPQNLEQRSLDPKIIRDNDLYNVKKADGAIFAFDGLELDSGTVVEFIAAKTLDKPSVVYRTDYRAGGDNHKEGGDSWNLMVSNYPKTKVINFDSIVSHYQHLSEKDINSTTEKLSDLLGLEIITSLDLLFKEPPIYNIEHQDLMYKSFDLWTGIEESITMQDLQLINSEL